MLIFLYLSCAAAGASLLSLGCAPLLPTREQRDNAGLIGLAGTVVFGPITAALSLAAYL